MAQPNAFQKNAFNRQRLIKTALKMTSDLGAQTANAGSSLRFKVLNSGLTTRFTVKISLAATVATTAPTLSPNGVHSLANRIRVTDYDGQDRISTHPSLLWAKQCLRERRQEGYASIDGAANGLATSGITALNGLTFPQSSLIVGASTVTNFFDVPVCKDPDAGDLRGIMPTNQNVGDAYVQIDLPAVVHGVNDDTKIFNTATGSVTGTPVFTVQVWQEYYLQQPDVEMGGIIPFPEMDALTVYEFISGITSDNLVSNAYKQITLPVNRAVSGIFYRWIHNSLQNTVGTNDLQKHQLMLGGSTSMFERTREYQLWVQRQSFGNDLTPGMYFQDFEGLPSLGANPLRVTDLGNITLNVMPNSAAVGNTFIEVAFESLYGRGIPLGSIIN